MANPTITLKRGEGWTNQGWRENKPILDRANRKTIQGLGSLGLSFALPKIGTVNRYGPGSRQDDTIGRALDERRYMLYVETIDGGTLRAVKKSYLWSATNLHENVHCIRSEWFDYDEDFMELAASEGLAYNAEELYVQKYGGKQIMSDFMDSELYGVDQQLLEAFNDIVRSPKSRYDRHAHKQWFVGKTKHTYVRDGSLLGAQLVQQQLQKGYTLPDLMKLPAEDVLGLS